MKKSIYFLIGLVFLLCSGCEKFLDIKSNATYVVPNSVADAQALLDDMFRMNESVVPTKGECFVDDYYLGKDAINFYRGSDELKLYQWDFPEYFGNANDWGFTYSAIYNANLAMEIVQKIERTPNNALDWDNVIGSALFFRGFYFYCLLTNYALAYDEQTSDIDPGIPLRLTSNFNEISHRPSVNECFDQIIDDMERSLNYLPDYPLIATRPSRGAVYAMLAKVYLYKRDYPKSLEYSEKALLINSQLMDYNGDVDIKDLNSESTPFAQFHKETIFYTEMVRGLEYPFYRGTVDSLLYDSYVSNDLRLNLYFNLKDGRPYFRGFYTGNIYSFGGLSTNELYLTKAECLAKLDRNEEAMHVMDALLVKRIEGYRRNDYFNSSSVLEFVRLERRKELLFRNARFADIKRYNKEGANIEVKRWVDGIEYILEPNSRKYALPLPTDLVGFTGMPQN